MKEVHDGLTYNTETAIEIGEMSGGGPSVTDFSYWHGTLYKTKKGRFFLAGSGGPLTRFSVSCGSGMTNGSGIKPLTYDEALALAEDHLDADVIEEHFNTEEA